MSTIPQAEDLSKRQTKNGPESEGIPILYMPPKPQEIAGEVRRRNDRIPADAPPPSKKKTDPQKQPGKGKEKADSGAGDGLGGGGGGGGDEGNGAGQGAPLPAPTVGPVAAAQAAPRQRGAAYYTWACHNCILPNGAPQHASMTTLIDFCPNAFCQHKRCAECPYERHHYLY